MTSSDWLIDIGLIFIVLRQLRWGQIDKRFIALPVVIVVVVARSYLHAIPTRGNDVLLVGACVIVGGLLGLAGGLVTKIAVRGGRPYARAGVAAASLWIGSMTARLALIVWMTHSAGEQTLARFSIEHHITGASVWQDALVLLALSEVVARIGTIVARGYLATGWLGSSLPAEPVTAAEPAAPAEPKSLSRA